MIQKLMVHVSLFLLLVAPALAADKNSIRLYSTASHQYENLDTALTELSAQDVVFLGEIHNNPVCHQVELSLFQGLVAKRAQVTLAMEMFERDVQPVLDGYLSGEVSADDLHKEARPWPNYDTDYAPLVEFARAQHLSVLASNLPQPLSTSVARHGLESLAAMPLHLMRYYARHTSAPADKYLELFMEAMSGHAGVAGADMDPAMTRFYTAQCLKDDTMAESVSDYLDHTGPTHPLVLHVNGAFHTDYGLGTAARTRSRQPQAKVAVVSMIPVDDPATVDPHTYEARGDYLIFVPQHP